MSLNIPVLLRDKKLMEKRTIFVNPVSEGTLNNVLDMLSGKVLNRGERSRDKGKHCDCSQGP